MIEHTVMPDGEPLDVPGIVPRLTETPGRHPFQGRRLGAHVEEVLASLGIAGADLQRLRAKRLIA